MRTEKYITILDPSLKNNDGDPSGNIGDLIIYDFIKDILAKIFPNHRIKRISTHVPFSKKEKTIINHSSYTFVGGTNILTSDIRNFPRLTPIKKKGFYFFPGIKDVILLGTGWSSYEDKIDWATKLYYNNILKKNKIHAVRDVYSQKQLENAGFKNILHTSCPSTWSLDTSFINKFNKDYKEILFTLNSYYPNAKEDNLLLEAILTASAEKNYFFPQTKEDSEYLVTLPAFKNNISKITFLNHSIKEFLNITSSSEINYIGNRLHGGIRCLAFNKPTLIISVDNRATEMGKSINLNVVERNNITQVKKWLSNEFIPTQLKLPKDNINRWIAQF